MLTFVAALAASQGARNQQEDAASLWPGPSSCVAPFERAPEAGRFIAALADGMGGHAGGARASRTVCAHFLVAFAEADAAIRDRLETGLWAANRAIAEDVAGNRSLEGMGSTLIGTAFGPEGLEWVSVGDSPLYFWRRGEIALVNEDHSLAPLLDKMAGEGRMTVAEASSDPRRHMLRSAITGEDLELVDLAAKPLALSAGDCVILASDGIHTLDEAEICRIVSAYVLDGPQAVASALVRAVDNIRAAHQDNVTVVVVCVQA